MTLVSFVDTLGERIERRPFLRRLGGASAAAVGAMLGVAAQAEAGHLPGHVHGCDLCDAPSGCPGSMVCVWCWTGRCHCGTAGSCHKHQCCEGYNTFSTCGGGCGSTQVCSYLGGNSFCAGAACANC